MSVESAMRGRFATNRRGRIRFWLALSATIAILLALPVEAAKTVKVKGTITAAEDLNPDYQGRPSPVNIIVFQLTSADTFQTADFFSLFEPDSPVLGGDMLGRTQILVKPGEVREWNPEFSKETRYIGIIAAYRDIENAQWRGLVELPKRGFIGRFFKKNKLHITVESLTVSVATK